MSAAETLGIGDAIRVRGARTHNLRGIDLDVPRYNLVVSCEGTPMARRSNRLDVGLRLAQLDEAIVRGIP